MEEQYDIHELKTWPVFFQAMMNGTKTFEVRKNDRDFKVGDRLDLMEYDPDAEAYTGAHCHRFISYILDANPFFDLQGNVILGLKFEQPSALVSGDIFNYLRTNILCHLSTDEMIELRNWLNGYETDQDQSQSNPAPRKSAEKVLLQNANLFEEHPFEEMYIKTKEAILHCMAEYHRLASQPQKVSDEAIADAAENYLQSLGNFRYKKEAKHDYMMGAKAMRDNKIK